MKLELKHLAPYLPHNLQVAYIGSDGWWKEFTNCDTTKDDYNYIGSLSQLSSKYVWLDLTKEGDTFEHHYEDVEPILRPMSEIYIVEKDLQNNLPNCPNFQYLISNAHVFEYHKKNLSKTFIEYSILNQLIEWHFDVFGLIENGLAIDRNTLP